MHHAMRLVCSPVGMACVLIAALCSPTAALADWATSNPKGWMLFDVIFAIVLSARSLGLLLLIGLCLRGTYEMSAYAARQGQLPSFRYQISRHIVAWLVSWFLVLPIMFLAPYEVCGRLMWATMYGSNIAPIIFIIWVFRRAQKAPRPQEAAPEG